MSQRPRWSVAAKAIVTLCLLALLVSLLQVLLVPALVDQLTGLNLDVGGSLNAVEGFFDRMIANLGWQLNTAELIGQLTSGFQAAIEPLFGPTIDIAFEFVSSIVWLVFIAVVFFRSEER